MCSDRRAFEKRLWTTTTLMMMMMMGFRARICVRLRFEQRTGIYEIKRFGYSLHAYCTRAQIVTAFTACSDSPPLPRSPRSRCVECTINYQQTAAIPHARQPSDIHNYVLIGQDIGNPIRNIYIVDACVHGYACALARWILFVRWPCLAQTLFAADLRCGVRCGLKTEPGEERMREQQADGHIQSSRAPSTVTRTTHAPVD